ncbi:MAG: hypothetical protein DRP86_04255 [Candidatus Neomarinimicrobiota bacterium]|nr:MAG: hypothetical protein DRP86_04255 [Candidatus Neomarinimicrobiota bacterium]
MKKGLILGLLTLLVAMFGVTGCEDTDYPDSAFDPNDPGKPTPVITEVNPALNSFQAVGLVEIYGENFSENISENVVFFNEGIGFPEPAETDLTASPQKMAVYAPVIIKDPAQWSMDSVKVRIAVQGAYLFGNYMDEDGNFIPYTLEKPAVEYGAFSDQILPLAVAVDKDENVYVTSEDGNVYKLMPTKHDSMIIYADRSHNNMTDLKFAPNGDLVYARNYTKLYYFPAGGGSRKTGIAFGGRVYAIDWDASGILYAAGNTNNLFALLTDGATIVENDVYEDYIVHSLKVFNSEIYTLAEYTGSDTTIAEYGIYKHDIQANGVVSAKSLVVDWKDTGFDDTTPVFMVLDENGNAFVSGADDGVPLVHVNLSDGSAKAIYNYPNPALSTKAVHMAFGNDNKLYMVRRSDRTDDNAPTPRLIRVSLDVNGAPYYGRP